MTKNILLAGVGGQGTILMSKILTIGLVNLGYDVKMSEIHGMSQRGGSVTTQIKYGDRVYAPNIGEGEADIVVAFEKIEALRALPNLKKGGAVIMDEREIYPMPVLIGAETYPSDAIEKLKELCSDVTVVKASEIAEQLGNVRAQNMVLLGALTKKLDLSQVDWKSLIGENVPPKARDLNLAAFEKGRALA